MSKLQAFFGASGADFGLLLLRLYFGATLALGHGFDKIKDLDRFSDKLAEHVPMAWLLGPAAGLSEFAGGLLVAIGLFTRPAAFFVLVTMLVAGFHMHAGEPFHRKELAFAHATVALALLLAGPGRFSLDQRGEG